MTPSTQQEHLLRVANSGERNTQQTGNSDATVAATTVQHTSLKALARLALARNNACNTAETGALKEGQQAGQCERACFAHESADVAGITLTAKQYSALDSMAADSAERHAGCIPPDDTAVIHCHHCGPVWAHPDIAAALPVVGGGPRALGCPWCFVRKAGGYIPRPPVTCGECQPD
jgi:hypothetical protein